MDYDIIKGKRTYQYFDGDVLYPFGHGLSYSEFTYSNLRIEQDRIPADGTVTIHVDVTNNSDAAGDEVVQLTSLRRSVSRHPAAETAPRLRTGID